MSARPIITPLVEIGHSFPGAQDLIEIGMISTESEHGKRVDDTPLIDSIPTSMNDVALDELMVDSSALRRVVIGQENHHGDTFFSDLSTLSTDVERSIGDSVRGKLSKVGR